MVSETNSSLLLCFWASVPHKELAGFCLVKDKGLLMIEPLAAHLPLLSLFSGLPDRWQDWRHFGVSL